MISSASPLHLFRAWFEEARQRALPDPNAMALATVDEAGRPSVRIVLMKDLDETGITFYTNYTSRKGRELAARPDASAVFFWAPLERQVRMEGQVAPVPRAESEAYFATRPRVSQLGAWASRQSQEVADYETLLKEFQRVENEYAGKPVPCPPHWGGFRMELSRIEYWQGKPGRLHDRYVLVREGSDWKKHQLFP